MNRYLDLLHRLVQLELYAPRNQDVILNRGNTTNRCNSTILSMLYKKQKSSFFFTFSFTSNMINKVFSFKYDFDEDFQILTWRKNHELKFPVLAKITRNILIIPAIIVASESAFSKGSSLAPDLVKFVFVKKIWIKPLKDNKV